jgi:hypothetical protein
MKLEKGMFVKNVDQSSLLPGAARVRLSAVENQ